MRRQTHIGIALLLLCLACREPFDGFDFVGSGTKLVVEAIVTDTGEHGYVRLSYSAPIQGGETPDYTYENEAIVTVSDDTGTTYRFAAADSGYYRNSNFRPSIGRDYRLEIQINENRFISSWASLPFENSDPLDLSYRPETVQVLNPLGNPVDDHRIMISDKLTRGSMDQRFYWQFNYFYIFDAYGQPELLPYLPGIERFCYVQDHEKLELMIHEDRAGFGDIGPEYSLDISSIPFGREMVYDYGVQVIRYSISEDIYQFFDQIRSQMGNDGGAFDSAPSQFVGNMTVLSGDLDVLGFFGLFNVASDYLFFNQDELPFEKLGFPTNDDQCARAPEGIDSLNHACWNCKAVNSKFNSVDKPSWWR